MYTVDDDQEHVFDKFEDLGDRLDHELDKQKDCCSDGRVVSLLYVPGVIVSTRLLVDEISIRWRERCK